MEASEELCMHCEEARVAVRCDVCAASYCRSCGAVLHKAASRKSHVLTPGEPRLLVRSLFPFTFNGDLLSFVKGACIFLK
jgi:hypothetical protein